MKSVKRFGGPIGVLLVVLAVAFVPAPNALDAQVVDDLADPALIDPNGTVERVVHISVDGLGSQWVNSALTPNIVELMEAGTSTLNARADGDTTQTMPNHTSQLTGRPALGPDGHGIDFNQWDPAINTNTIHDEAGEYVVSVFDVVHDNGLKTASYVSKEKLEIYDLSWGVNGAPDVTGPNNGTNKFDTFERSNPAAITASAINELETDPANYTFIHLRGPDTIGHRDTWGSVSYQDEVIASDALVGDVLAAIIDDPDLAGTTAVIVTADHGGVPGATSHIDNFARGNFTIPFVYWGPTVGAGLDFYAEQAGVRTDPGTAYSPNLGGTTAEPIRGHDASNLALGLLGLDPIQGSVYDFEVGAPGPGPDPVGPCTVTATGAGVTVEWTLDGQVFLRRNGDWRATPAGQSFVDSSGTAADSYELRQWTGGVLTVTPCTLG